MEQLLMEQLIRTSKVIAIWSGSLLVLATAISVMVWAVGDIIREWRSLF